MNTVGETYWVCEKCGRTIKAGEYHVCPQEPATYSVTFPPDYYTTLERIEQILLRIEKLLEKEL